MADNNDGSTVGLIAVCVIAFIAILFGFMSFKSIPAGYAGVVTQFGGVTGTVMEQGLHWKAPIIQSVKVINMQTQKYTADKLTAASKDLQNVTTTIALNYKPDPTQIVTLYKTVGMDYMNVVADPAIQETVKEITAKYNAEECITNRVTVKGAITDEITTKMAERGIIIESVNITDFQFSPEFTAAIEAKVVAQQQIETAQNKQEQAKVEAATAVIIAQGQANANKILEASLDQELLNYLLYTQSGNKTIIVPAGGYPIVVNPN